MEQLKALRRKLFADGDDVIAYSNKRKPNKRAKTKKSSPKSNGAFLKPVDMTNVWSKHRRNMHIYG